MNFKRTNNIVGWVICIIACTVYIMTMEATGSLWDCGEFISSAYKVQVPHPPGAPLFVLLGRKINFSLLIYFFMSYAILLPPSQRKDITVGRVALLAAMLAVLAPSAMASAALR